METTLVSRVMDYSATEVWAVIEDFADYRWGEGVGSATVDGDPLVPGAIRRFSYYEQPSQQRLVELDSDKRLMSWESVEAFDATLSYYRATVQVAPDTMSGRSVVEWSVEFDAEPNSTDKWKKHQEIEFEKSLDRLNLYVDWRSRGLV